MNRTREEFDKAWNAPNTLYLERLTMAVMPAPEGVKIILHHDGNTLAMRFNAEEADDLRAALGACL